MLTTSTEQDLRRHRLGMVKFDACSTIRIHGLGKQVDSLEVADSLLTATVVLKSAAALVDAFCGEQIHAVPASGGVLIGHEEGNVRFVAFEPVGDEYDGRSVRFSVYTLPTGEHCITDRLTGRHNHWANSDCLDSVARWVMKQLIRGGK